jgi:RHS repeat-associated protein
VNNKWKTKTRKVKENYTETNRYFYHIDHLWSVVAITDESATIIEEYEYDAFWKVYSKLPDGTIKWLKASPIKNTRFYTGRELDRWLKLYYNRARYYHYDLGRFIQRDPIDVADDVNLYAYVGNSPMIYTDRMGREKVLIILATGKDWADPIFDNNGLITNTQWSFNRQMYNTLISWENFWKYDVKVISSFQEFDDAVNSKQRQEIHLIGHWNAELIQLDSSNRVSLNKTILDNDTQSQDERDQAFSTALTLYSCNVWADRWFWRENIAEMIQEHYWFKYTAAPSTTIWSDWIVVDSDWSPTRENYLRQVKWENEWEWNYFTNN